MSDDNSPPWASDPDLVGSSRIEPIVVAIPNSEYAYLQRILVWRSANGRYCCPVPPALDEIAMPVEHAMAAAGAIMLGASWEDTIEGFRSQAR